MKTNFAYVGITKTSVQMEAVRKASAGQPQIDKFRDSMLNRIVKVAITAMIAE